MAVYHDRVQIVRFAAGLEDDDKFVEELKSVFEDTKDPLRAAKSSIARWRNSLSYPQSDQEDAVLRFFLSKFPKEHSKIKRVLDRHVHHSISDLLEIFDVSYDIVQAKLSSVGNAEWVNRYHKMQFMDELSKQAEDDPRSRLVLRCMIGSYYMYRRHSTLPGILKEKVLVEERHQADCRGTYYQYDKHEGHNTIKFNAFPCGNYVQAFGSFPRSNKLEIIDTRILVTNSLRETDNKTRVDNDETKFVGMLTGIYDFGDTLLGERVFIHKINNDPSLDDGIRAIRLMSDSNNPVEQAEFKRVRDIISNARDGQTLATRLERLELE